MKKTSDHPLIFLIWIFGIVLFIVISRWIPELEKHRLFSTILVCLFLLALFLDKLFQIVSISRATTTGLNFFEAMISLTAAQYDYPGRLPLMIVQAALVWSIIAFQLLYLLST